MTEFVGRVSSEETFLLGRIHGAFPSVEGCPEVRRAVVATTTVELLSDSSNRRLKIVGMLSHHDSVLGGQQSTGAPMHIVYSRKANRELRWSAPYVGRALQQQRDVSIPNNVDELCDCCFEGCESLRRVTFGSSSSLERIGVCCFALSGVEEVRIPDSVRELCDRCFYGCRSLRRVTFGSSSSLEWIGVSCFDGSGIEDVIIRENVRALCNRCFSWCKRLLNALFCE